MQGPWWAFKEADTVVGCGLGKLEMALGWIKLFPDVARRDKL
jgi:hypothetical protein